MSIMQFANHRPGSVPPGDSTLLKQGGIQNDSIFCEFELTGCTSEYAGLIVSWVETDRDLFLLAPATAPPLTVEKVEAWVTQRDNPLLLRRVGIDQPVGYAELNFMPRESRDLWIGHLLVPKAVRGQGVGYALMQHLLRHAFAHFGASRVSLVVFPENEVAVHCYLKCGFVKDGMHVKSFDHLNGKYKMLKMQITHRQYRRSHVP